MREETQITEVPSLSPRVAVLEQQMTDLKKNHENLITRLWMIGIPVFVAVLGGFLTALLRR